MIFLPGTSTNNLCGVEPSARTDPPAWFANPQTELLDAIAELKSKLPGWWYYVCECQVSCDARIAPTSDSPDIQITYSLPAGSKFDEGFDVGLTQPSTLAEALRYVIAEALEAKAEHASSPEADTPNPERGEAER